MSAQDENLRRIDASDGPALPTSSVRTTIRTRQTVTKQGRTESTPTLPWIRQRG
jgi:hypothetical protein